MRGNLWFVIFHLLISIKCLLNTLQINIVRVFSLNLYQISIWELHICLSVVVFVIDFKQFIARKQNTKYWNINCLPFQILRIKNLSFILEYLNNLLFLILLLHCLLFSNLYDFIKSFIWKSLWSFKVVKWKPYISQMIIFLGFETLEL